MKLKPQHTVLIKHFISFAKKELNLHTIPPIEFVNYDLNPEKTFGVFKKKDSHIKVRVKDRHPIDIMRTVAHELTHYKQKQTKKTGEQKLEDDANAIAGRIMRKYDIKHGNVFKDNPLTEDGVAAVATNAMGTSSSTAGTGPIDTYDPLLNKKKKLNDILRRRVPNG
jgi:hypothetical protein